MFVLTQDKVKLNELVSAISAAVSIVCCLVVLLLALWIWTVREARHCLDRISFRLLLWSLAFEIVYDINYIAVCVGGIQETIGATGCTTGVYLMMGTMGVVNYLCTFIAVNLAVTIVFGLNPIVLRLERWYIGISLFVGMFVPIVPAALGHFGVDPLYHVCWIKADTDTARIRNFVLDLYLWQLLSCAIASVAVIATLVTLFRQGRATSRALFGGDSINFTLSSTSEIESSDDPESGEKPARPGFVMRALRKRRNSIRQEKIYGHLEDRFIRIALRISAYPITLIIVNGLISIGDLYLSAVGGVHSRTSYGLYCLYYFLYGGRGIFFVMLALLDPCLTKGLATVWRLKHPSDKDGSQPSTQAVPWTGSALSDKLPRGGADVPPPDPVDMGALDMRQALFFLDQPSDDEPDDGDDTVYEQSPRQRGRSLIGFLHRQSKHHPSSSTGTGTATGTETAPPTSPPTSPPTPSGPVFSETFAGVPADGLWAGIEDNADDVVRPDVLEAVQLEQIASAPNNLRRGSRTDSGIGSRPASPPHTTLRTAVSSVAGDAGPASSPLATTFPQSNEAPESLPVTDGIDSAEARRQRRKRARERAERIYEDMEAQL